MSPYNGTPLFILSCDKVTAMALDHKVFGLTKSEINKCYHKNEKERFVTIHMCSSVGHICEV